MQIDLSQPGTVMQNFKAGLLAGTTSTRNPQEQDSDVDSVPITVIDSVFKQNLLRDFSGRTLSHSLCNHLLATVLARSLQVVSLKKCNLTFK